MKPWPAKSLQKTYWGSFFEKVGTNQEKGAKITGHLLHATTTLCIPHMSGLYGVGWPDGSHNLPKKKHLRKKKGVEGGECNECCKRCECCSQTRLSSMWSHRKTFGKYRSGMKNRFSVKGPWDYTLNRVTVWWNQITDHLTSNLQASIKIWRWGRF